MAHHHFSIVPSCVYMRVGGRFLYLQKPESLLIQKGTHNCVGVPLFVCKYVHAYEVLIFVRYAESKSEHNNDHISSRGARQPPRTNGQISVCPLFALHFTNKYTYS